MRLRSELTSPGGAVATRDAWLPPGSSGALAATAAADAFWLWAQARQFPYLSELAPAPVRSATLAPHALSRLDQRPAAAGLLAAAAYAGGMLLLSPAGPLALGRRFELTPDTMLWLTWRDSGAPDRWHGLHPLADGRVVLQPAAGPARLVDPHHDRSTPLPAAPAAAHRSAGEPPRLLTVTPNGTAVWHRPGLLATRQPAGGAVAVAALELPPGSIAPAAVTGDARGAVWAFDPRERRIRVFGPGAGNGAGLRQLFAVTPLLPRAELAGVQTLAVTAAGHVLIGSRRAIWKIDRRGLPVWSLRLLNTNPRQRLPQAFAVAAREENEEQAAFLLLDRTTGALHRFIEQPQPEAAPAPDQPPLLLRAPGATPPGALAAALTDNALRAAQRAWQRDSAGAAHRLLAAARRSLSRWRAADPLARDADRRAAAIETLAPAVEQALYGEPGDAGD